MSTANPDLIADVTLYATDQGGKKTPTGPDWYGCPCKVHKDDTHAWDCRLLLEGRAMHPGETRRLGIVFFSGQTAAQIFRDAGKLYLWEGRIIGEAIPVSNETPAR